LNDLVKKVAGGWISLFSKALQIYAIWQTPDWTAAGIIAKVKATYDLFNVPVPNPGPMTP
jgi:hypothetical protein